ncbi:MAG: AAA family ATPase [Bacteroidia bacterium]|nr:AAA family ATPase [Bacteroidia bacterium]
MTALRSRYPGLRPFDPEEQQNFFGRTEEIEALCRLLDLDRLIILHGPSGMGKSSLINAGILPALSNVRRWEVPFHIVKVRFTNYDPTISRIRQQQSGTPVQDLVKDPVDRFIEACLGPDHRWPEVLPLPKPSFWLSAKQVMVDQEIHPLRLVFVLDQFEELFTYPEERVNEFAFQLGELYHQVQPEAIRRGLARKRILEGEAPGPQPGPHEVALLEQIDSALDVKILISMRSDKLHYLERLKPYLPEMMLNSFELRSFDREQAKGAILEPASLEGPGFLSPPFEIGEAVMTEILGFLEDKLTRRIEPAQLQIICQHLEQRMAAKAKKKSR